ncbi:hypothetical protein GCM10011533_08150 [Streptosporangium jomthongense]|nr:hypothetical protein GCM10011533_08150 [Streptosporangium jomthongense]
MYGMVGELAIAPSPQPLSRGGGEGLLLHCLQAWCTLTGLGSTLPSPLAGEGPGERGRGWN